MEDFKQQISEAMGYIRPMQYRILQASKLAYKYHSNAISKLSEINNFMEIAYKTLAELLEEGKNG